MSEIVPQITGVSIVYSTVCLGPDQRKHQSSASLAFVRWIHRWPAQRASNAENVSIWWRRHGLIMPLVDGRSSWFLWQVRERHIPVADLTDQISGTGDQSLSAMLERGEAQEAKQRIKAMASVISNNSDSFVEVRGCRPHTQYISLKGTPCFKPFEYYFIYIWHAATCVCVRERKLCWPNGVERVAEKIISSV